MNIWIPSWIIFIDTSLLTVDTAIYMDTSFFYGYYRRTSKCPPWIPLYYSRILIRIPTMYLWILLAYLKMSAMDTSIFFLDTYADTNNVLMDTTSAPQNVRHGYTSIFFLDTPIFFTDTNMDTFNRTILDTSFLQAVPRFSLMDPEMDTIF